MSGWARLAGLAPGVRGRAGQAIADIATALERPPPPIDGDRAALTGLLVREPGFSLFYAYLDRTAPRASHRGRARRLLERAIACVPAMSGKPFFSHGFSGTAWAVEHLGGWIVPRDPRDNDEIDAALLHLVEEASSLDHGIQYGLVGFGIYALERLPHPGGRRLLEAIIARLAGEAIPARGGLCWQSSRAWSVGIGAARLPDDAVFPGVYSGVAGVVGLMGAAVHHRVATRSARRQLEGGLAWLWAVRSGRDGLFASPAQLSWSVGSLGIATVAHAAARAARLDDWRARALRLARRLARSSGAVSRLRDTNFGNGAAGAAHMFHRLHRATGEELFAGSAQSWISRLLARRRPGAGMAGYRVYIPVAERAYLGRPDHPVGWLGLPGLYNGIAGIGLVLLSATSDEEPAWDRAFLLSHR